MSGTARQKFTVNWLNMRIVFNRVMYVGFGLWVLALFASAQDSAPAENGAAVEQAESASAEGSEVPAKESEVTAEETEVAEEPSAPQGYDAALEKYGAEPVPATQINGPNQFSPIILLDLTAGGLVMKYPNLESPITIPEDQLTFAVAYRPQMDAEKYNQLVEEGKQDEALEMIREEVYPLLKFVRVDPQTVRIHSLVIRLLDDLIAAGEINEAATIMESFPRSRLTGIFREQAVQVADELVVDGQIDRAYDLVKQFPLGPGQMEFAPVYLDLANEFRLRGEWEKSRNLYKDVQLASSPTETPEAFLWEAYIHLQEGRDFMVDGVLDQFGNLNSQSRFFSLRELVRGVLMEERGDEKGALSAIARGLVYSTTNDPWTPELLYRAADLYEAQDYPNAAFEIRDQLRFFYPDSVWVDRL